MPDQEAQPLWHKGVGVFEDNCPVSFDAVHLGEGSGVCADDGCGAMSKHCGFTGFHDTDAQS